MRKPILIESRSVDDIWPKENIDKAIESLYRYLSYYEPEEYKYSKYAIMGPVGKLLPALLGEQFGDNVQSYVGYIANIHSQGSNKHLTTERYEELQLAINTILEIKTKVSQRAFIRIIRAIDYGIFFKRSEEIAMKSEHKQHTKVEKKQ